MVDLIYFLLQAIVREHFACPTLEGAELEDQGSIGTALTHWEKRLFEVSSARKKNSINHLYNLY